MDADEPIWDIATAVAQLEQGGTTHKYLFLIGTNYTDADFAELADLLITNPDAFTHVLLNGNRLTDVSGSKLACYVARSSRLVLLEIPNNDFTDATMIAISRAARTFGSLLNFAATATSSGLEDEMRGELGDLAEKPKFNWCVTGPGCVCTKL